MVRHRAPVVCPRHGCINDQPCPTHTPPPWATSTRASRLPTNWPTIRRRILKRDGNTCRFCAGQRCGNQHLEVHHIGNPDDHSDANLVTVGHDPCHDEITRKQALESRRRG